MEKVELLAAYFTLSGDIHPFGPTEISPFDFKFRVEAAAKAGYKGIGLVHADLMHTADQIGLKEMKNILELNGIKHVEFEFLDNWYERGDRRRASDKMRDELLAAAGLLEARDIKIAPGLFTTEVNIPLMVEEFAKLCQRAADVGTSIVLEIMPFSNVSTMDTALGIVQGANRSNGGLLLDIWHLSRGGIDFTEIEKIPAEFIGAVELDDADRYPVNPLWKDTIHKRKLPGEGVLDIAGFIRAIQAKGYKGPWGVEVLSEVVRKLPLEDMAKRTFDTSFSQFGQL
ncbi:sugar phosphate isomerase/epimerase family protein [Pedobacter deserti]|uniref:sugar phosphate isomerase/epimerase family protein n=1 Tax=Pedobacter deserti TaxID=2817382 RepID=UPI00210CEE16|nr:sugar phosphate isomerase/epimerase [Pedobacter sp. SYSU D00382]